MKYCVNFHLFYVIFISITKCYYKIRASAAILNLNDHLGLVIDTVRTTPQFT